MPTDILMMAFGTLYRHIWVLAAAASTAGMAAMTWGNRYRQQPANQHTPGLQITQPRQQKHACICIMYLFIYTYMHVHIYIYTYVCVFLFGIFSIYTHLHIRIYIYMNNTYFNVRMKIYVHTCRCV